MLNPKPAKFITFEGGEGSGKSTQSKLLYEYLVAHNIPAVHTREVGGTEIAESIRQILIYNRLYSVSELLLIMAARYEHVNKLIIPALLEQKWVICDRFIDSTACYQSTGLNLSLPQVNDLTTKLNTELTGELTRELTIEQIYDLHNKLICVKNKAGNEESSKAVLPDLTFFIDINPYSGLKRAKARGNNNKFEKQDMIFHQQIYDKFCLIAKKFPTRIKVIKTRESDTIDAIHQQIVSFL